jgi:hypothetical protein
MGPRLRQRDARQVTRTRALKSLATQVDVQEKPALERREGGRDEAERHSQERTGGMQEGKRYPFAAAAQRMCRPPSLAPPLPNHVGVRPDVYPSKA